MTKTRWKTADEIERFLWFALKERSRKFNLGIWHDSILIFVPLASFLFLRWLDQFEEEQESLARSEGFEVHTTLPRQLRWRSWQNLRGEELSSFFKREFLPWVESMPPGNTAYRLRRVVAAIEHFITNFMEYGLLYDPLLEWVREIPFETPYQRQQIGKIFDSLLYTFSSNSILGRVWAEHIIPNPIADLMVELANPRPGERVYDPCFGMGDLLVRCAQRMRWPTGKMPQEACNDEKQAGIYGIEMSNNAYSVAMTRLTLAGINHPLLEWADTLAQPLIQDWASGGFDCILAVPPWRTNQPDSDDYRFSFREMTDILASPKVTPSDSHQEFRLFTPVRPKHIETSFLQHIMYSLRPGGRAVVALPEAWFWDRGKARKVRENLTREYRVECMLSLPPGSFRPFSSLNGLLILFHREMSGSQVRFYTVPSLEPLLEEKELGGDASYMSRALVRRFREGNESNQLWEVPTENFAKGEWGAIAEHLYDKTLEHVIQGITETDFTHTTMPLSEVAEVLVGVTYTKNETSPLIDGPELGIGLVRVSDMTKGKVVRPKLFLTSPTSKRIQERARLLPGDVLVSISGTIGKVSIVTHGAVGAVASKSIAILRLGAHVNPDYLAKLLQSERYQQWFQNQARGRAIRHLSIKTLRRLEVLVPSLSFQLQVLSDTDKNQRDAISASFDLALDESKDPIARWLQLVQSQLDIERFGERGFRGQGEVWLEHIVTEISRLKERIDSGKALEAGELLLIWLREMERSTRSLQGIGNEGIEGAGKLVMYHDARYEILRVLFSMAGLDGSPYRQAKELMRTMISVLTNVIEHSYEFDSGHLGDFRLSPSWVTAGQNNQVELSADVPFMDMQELKFTTYPDIGNTKKGYVTAWNEISMNLTIPDTIPVGEFNFILHWEAIRLDGYPTSGAQLLSLEVRPKEQIKGTEDLGISPYIVGGPVDRKEMFFGRQGIVDRIRRQLSTVHRANVVLLEGNRRTGKTSILVHLEDSDTLPGWITVNCSFQGGQGHEREFGLPTREVFKLIARKIGFALDAAQVYAWFPEVDPPDPIRPFKTQFSVAVHKAFDNDSPFETFEQYLRDVLAIIAPRRLLLMFDEFDKLQEGIDAGITSPQLPENIRYLLHTYKDISAILTGSLRLKRLREEYWSALFGLGHRIPVEPLEYKEAQKLVEQPVEGRLSYVPQARDRVVDLCARQPFLIQSLCNRIFECAAMSDERSVTLNMVDAAANEMVHDNEHFRTLWGYAGTWRKRLILATCEQMEELSQVVTIGLLEEKLMREYQVPMLRGERLGADLEDLMELELLVRGIHRRISTYRLAVPLMGRWIRYHVDMEDVRNRAVHEAEEKL